MFPIPVSFPRLSGAFSDAIAANARLVAHYLPALGIGGFIWANRLDSRVDPIIVILVEAVLVGWLVDRIVRVAMRLRAIDVRRMRSIRDLFLTAFPGPIRHVFLGEIVVWMSLWRLVTRRWRKGGIPFTSYRASNSLGLPVVVILTAPAEILLRLREPTVIDPLTAEAVPSILFTADTPDAPGRLHPESEEIAERGSTRDTERTQRLEFGMDEGFRLHDRGGGFLHG